MSSRSNPNKLTTQVVTSAPEKRGHPSTSSSSSCDSPNQTVIKSNKHKILKKDESPEIMGLTKDDLDKIEALMNKLLDQKLETFTSNQEVVKKHIDKMEKLTREKNIVNIGIPEQGDDMDTNINSVNELCDKIGIDKILVDDVYRVGKKGGTKDRPLIVKCALMVDKKRLMKASKSLRKESIYLNDDLSQEERIASGKLRAHFKVLKKASPDISYSFRNNVMAIWKDNVITERFGVKQGTVQLINQLEGA